MAIVSEIQTTKFYAIIADEVSDVSSRHNSLYV